MSDQTQQNETMKMLESERDLALIGFAISGFAVVLGALYPWMYDNFAPLANSDLIKSHWMDYWPSFVLIIALIGIVSGSWGAVKQKKHLVGSLSVLFGIFAVISVYVWIALIVFVVIILIAALVFSFGVSF